MSITSGFVLPETVTDPEAAVKARVNGDAAVNVLNYGDAEVTTESDVVVATEERHVDDALSL